MVVNLGFLSLMGILGSSTYNGNSSRKVLQQLASSRDVQDGSCLVSMLCGNSLVLAQTPIIVVGVSCSCGRFNFQWWSASSSACGVKSALLAAERLLSTCDVQWAPLEFWWRAPLKVQGLSALVVWVTPWGQSPFYFWH